MSKNFIQSAVLRSMALGAYRAYASVQVWRTGPRIFLNSLPKAGTHLLMSIFDQTPNIMNSRLHVRNSDVGIAENGHRDHFDPEKLKILLKKVRAGQVVTAHMPYTPAAEAVLVELGYKTILLVRDPKDLLISRLHYILGLKRHSLNTWLSRGFPDERQRLLALIHGGGAAFPEIAAYGDSIAGFVGWQTSRDALTIRFEDIVGLRGGGDDVVREQSLARLFHHMGLPKTDLSAYTTRASATFRKGVIGDWQHSFDDEVLREYNGAVAPHAEMLGYSGLSRPSDK